MKQKIKQILVTDIHELILLAEAQKIICTPDIAKWIILVSPYWRSKGYYAIVRAIKGDAV